METVETVAGGVGGGVGGGGSAPPPPPPPPPRAAAAECAHKMEMNKLEAEVAEMEARQEEETRLHADDILNRSEEARERMATVSGAVLRN